MNASSEAFRRHTSARLQAQFLEEPDWTSTRSLANVLDSVVEAAMSGDVFQVTPSEDESSSEHQLTEEISALEFQLAQYRERLGQLHAEKASLRHPSKIAGRQFLDFMALHVFLLFSLTVYCYAVPGLPSLADTATTLEGIKERAEAALE